MVVNITKEKIIKEATKQFALFGLEGASMRKIADKVGISQSVIYHHFDNQRQMLDEVAENAKKILGEKRSKLSDFKSTKEILDSRIDFQMENAIYVVAILKHFMTFHDDYKKHSGGYVPNKAYTHMLEVLDFGIKEGDINPDIDRAETAKVMAHAVNGYVLEYFPNNLTSDDKEVIKNQLSKFILRSITLKGGENE